MERNAETKWGHEEGKEEVKLKGSHGNLPELVMMSQTSPNPTILVSFTFSFDGAGENGT